MKNAALIRRLSGLETFDRPDPKLEQVATPPEAAAELLNLALQRGDLEGRSVADLGAGTGLLGIGAKLLGAREVVAIEVDPDAVEVARRNATKAKVDLRVEKMDVERFAEKVDTVVMNPPFGAQRRHADLPFWDAALRSAQRGTYAFALADSRTFIARRAVERAASIAENRPVRWVLPASFPHHTKPQVPIPVDLWVLGAAKNP
ncbi:MAG TPA: METTL5 family protein [Thermoplasmata archaeon]|nr:METTL5 family protein [Thermoplasmata archaeon]